MSVSVRAISSYSQVGHIGSGPRCSNMSPLMIISVLSISKNRFGVRSPELQFGSPSL